ncbi:MAG: LysM peptidoglycan-binding domain-containing protein, partial [Pyrinomonadaceae bacterium]
MIFVQTPWLFFAGELVLEKMLRLATYTILFLSIPVPAAVATTTMAARGAALMFEIDLAQEPETRTVRARSGDTLRKISQRLGIPLADLVRLNEMSETVRLPKGMRIVVPVAAADSAGSSGDGGQVVGNRITLSDGYSFEADEVWKDGDVIWYRKGNISQRLEGPVKSVKPIVKPQEAKTPAPPSVATQQQLPPLEKPPMAIWIYLVGGARFKVDEVQETADGAWYSRGKLSIFMERE